MTHLKSVRVHSSNGETHSHWIANAPLGKEVEWVAAVTGEEENEYIAWQSLPGSTVQSAGIVRFGDAPDGRCTVVTIDMQYNPPAGSMISVFAKVFGEEPAQQVREDLHPFKQMMQTGEIASVEGQATGRNENFGESIEEKRRDTGKEVCMKAVC